MFIFRERQERRVRFLVSKKKMHRSIVLLLALVATVALAVDYDWIFSITNNKKKVTKVPVIGRRLCICLKNSQTAKITNIDAGVMKLFSTTDCTGNFAVLKKGSTRSNAQWVMSASVGVDGIPSAGPYDCSPQN
ncbi:hypothetical protein BGW42_006366 [Actinomortierella wolfii]|nr:hypothetical protein BGW42_006366 [Actinomortierella wolfii]